MSHENFQSTILMIIYILHMTLSLGIIKTFLRFCGVSDDNMCGKYKYSLVTKGLIN